MLMPIQLSLAQLLSSNFLKVATNHLKKVQTLLPLYKEVLESLIHAGAEYIQIDEPILVTDDSESYENITKEAYDYCSSWFR